jgi:hypothetical protein
MKSIFALGAVALLATACASRLPPVDETTLARHNAEWQAERAAYTVCGQDKANALLRTSASAPDVVDASVRACQPTLESVRTSFRQYVELQMMSDHGKEGARQAADQMAVDAETKLRGYLLPYVEYTRYQAGIQ